MKGETRVLQTRHASRRRVYAGPPTTVPAARQWAGTFYRFVVPEILRIATAVVALALGVWAGLAVVRNRPPTATQLIWLWVVELFALALVGTAIAHLAGGHHVTSLATFVGYLVAFVAIPVIGWSLARLEPTKWGSVIVVSAAVVEAILIVRLDQVWTGV